MYVCMYVCRKVPKLKMHKRHAETTPFDVCVTGRILIQALAQTKASGWDGHSYFLLDRPNDRPTDGTLAWAACRPPFRRPSILLAGPSSAARQMRIRDTRKVADYQLDKYNFTSSWGRLRGFIRIAAALKVPWFKFGQSLLGGLNHKTRRHSIDSASDSASALSAKGPGASCSPLADAAVAP